MTVIEFDAARPKLLPRRAAGETPMPDPTAIEVSEREIAAPLTATALLHGIRRFATAALFTAALAAAGTVLFTLALAVAMVGSPLIAAAILYVVVRRLRAGPAPAAWTPAT